MTLFTIGDVQGCTGQANALMDRLRSASDHPEFMFVGDLVNRGPDSLGTLRQICALGHTASAVLGNHDLHLLAVANGIRKPGRSDTLEGILNAPDRHELLDWLRHQPLARFQDGFLMVHAGVLPQWTAQQTIDLAHEVETVLRGPDWVDFLREMYGNAPTRWDDTLRGVDRLRCIVNALTRIRYCHADGAMEFSIAEQGTDIPPGVMPWFDIPSRKTADVTVVFAHWSARGLLLRPNLIGLDTGCVWGGKLTAVRLEDRAVFQVDCPQYQQPG
ncbi:MAG TPA: symmetrical bis(5'-nucleosyl)-tetraphosphatase [Burkholderiaceae bacterium]|nr:symmetrical bis(5'-nucleosyl)-tetraphosphatase [Burkholderiaceae bacterium]